MPEALCPAGGEIFVSLKNWRKNSWEKEWIFTAKEEKVKKAVCIRPQACKLRQYCTGKTQCIPSGNNGLNKLIVSKVILYNNTSFVLFRESF